MRVASAGAGSANTPGRQLFRRFTSALALPIDRPGDPIPVEALSVILAMNPARKLPRRQHPTLARAAAGMRAGVSLDPGSSAVAANIAAIRFSLHRSAPRRLTWVRDEG